VTFIQTVFGHKLHAVHNSD